MLVAYIFSMNILRISHNRLNGRLYFSLNIRSSATSTFHHRLSFPLNFRNLLLIFVFKVKFFFYSMKYIDVIIYVLDNYQDNHLY